MIHVMLNTSHLSLCFNGHFPGGPGLADTRTSPFWILFGTKDDGGGEW